MEDKKKYFVKDGENVTRNIAGETIIVPVKARVGDLDSIYTLNEVGTLIWKLMDERATVRQMVEALTEEYDVDAAQAEKDIFDYLGSLEAAGLVKSQLS